MQTSERGIGFLKRHEQVVLRAYRCPAGIWTIGAGLTKASGVVDPGPGMVITEAEADRLLALALAKYERRTDRAMPGASQPAFDGGVSFDFNTGAIHRASWVPAWIGGNMPKMREQLRRWNRGGGRVLPGLTRRREEEANLIEYGDYGRHAPPPVPFGLARVPLDLSPDELTAARIGFEMLGYAPGPDARGVDVVAVRRFQADHDLTVDGIMGRATLSTLQRRLDARGKAATGAGVTATGGAATAADVPVPEWAVGFDVTILLAGAAALLWLAWTYRDVLAAKLAPHLPRLAALLRSLK
jgi:lysozyme